jgi:hypothetical protein
LAAKGTIRRLARGIYDYPKTHPVLGTLAPSPEAIAKAVVGRDRTKIQPSGPYAANLLGLSPQVPARIVFLTDGPAKTVRFGKQEIQLKQTTPRNMAAAGRVSGLVIQALRNLGQRNVTTPVIQQLKRSLKTEEKRQLQQDIELAPAWIGKYLREIAQDI